MPSKHAPEFYYDEKTELYRKRVMLPSGGYKDLRSKDPAKLRKRVAELKQAIEEQRYSLENPTVAEYALRWSAHRLPGLSYARQEDYRNAVNNHILPGLGGNKLMAKVTPEDIKLLMASKSALSRSTQGKIVSTLKQIFASAEEDGIVRRSPCAEIKAGGKPAKEKQPLSDAQQDALIEATAGTIAHPFVMLGLYAGLRREEILGLQWDCVHLGGQTPYLEVQRAGVFEGNKAVVKSELKTAAARRKVPMPPALRDCLRSCRIQNPYDFVVPNSQGGPRTRQSFRKLWEAVENRTEGEMRRWDKEKGKTVTVSRSVGQTVQNHGYKVTLDFHCTPHQLRHTYITRLCASGMDIKKIQYLAGHATVQMTLNIYAHVVNNRPEDLLGDVSAAFSSLKVPPLSAPIVPKCPRFCPVSMSVQFVEMRIGKKERSLESLRNQGFSLSSLVTRSAQLTNIFRCRVHFL